MSHDNLVFAAQLVGLALGWAAISGPIVWWQRRRQWHHRSYCAGMKTAAGIFGNTGIWTKRGWQHPQRN
jgi:fatty-acid desaturase